MVPCAFAQPANDAWANRMVVASLPFNDSQTSVESATVEATDPELLCRVGPISQGASTLWYEFTTGGSVEYVNLTTQSSNYDTIIAVYAGDPGTMALVAGGCNDDGVYGEFQSRIAGLRLPANTRYSVAVTRYSASVVAATLNFAMVRAPLYPVSTTIDTSPEMCDYMGCTLREAITAANVTPGAILLPPGVFAFGRAGSDDDTNATGDLDIRNGMGIYGSGAGDTIIDAVQVDRALHVDPLAFNRLTVTVADLTLRGGTVDGEGGAVLVSGTATRRWEQAVACPWAAAHIRRISCRVRPSATTAARRWWAPAAAACSRSRACACPTPPSAAIAPTCTAADSA